MIMLNNKMKLSQLKVTSFTTKLNKAEVQTVKGGHEVSVGTCRLDSIIICDENQPTMAIFQC